MHKNDSTRNIIHIGSCDCNGTLFSWSDIGNSGLFKYRSLFCLHRVQRYSKTVLSSAVQKRQKLLNVWSGLSALRGKGVHRPWIDRGRNTLRQGYLSDFGCLSVSQRH